MFGEARAESPWSVCGAYSIASMVLIYVLKGERDREKEREGGREGEVDLGPIIPFI